MSSVNNPLANAAAGEYKSLTRDPTTSFIVNNVPAPTQLYIGDDNFIRLQVQNTSVATNVTVRTRMIRSDDHQITTSEDVFQVAQNGAVQSFFVNLTEGFLLSAIVSCEGSQAVRGLLFVSLELCHGSRQNVHRDVLLIQDYVAQTYSASWPGGSLRLATEGPGAIVYQVVGAPGAGFDIAIGYTPNIRVRLMTLSMRFSTSAVVANRFPRIQLVAGGNVVYAATVAAAIPASTVAQISVQPGGGQPSVSNNVHIIPVPQTLYLNGSPTIVTATAGIDAGDTYSQIFAVSEEWIDA